MGIAEDIINSSINAIVSAVKQMEAMSKATKEKNERITDILNYIHTNYLTVSLDELSQKYFLSKPYLSKYIKDQTGKTFGDHVKEIRLEQAAKILKNGSIAVENGFVVGGVDG